MTGKPKDITGLRVNMLVAIKFVKTIPYAGKRTGAVWLWKCDCGKRIELPAKAVLYPGGNRINQKFSCGCQGAKKKRFGQDALANQVFVRHYRDGDLTFEQFKQLAESPCFYCGAKPSNKHVHTKNKKRVWLYNGLDRLYNNNRKHDADNVVSCCWVCNQMKKIMSIEEFYAHIETILQRKVLHEENNHYPRERQTSHQRRRSRKRT